MYTAKGFRTCINRMVEIAEEWKEHLEYVETRRAEHDLDRKRQGIRRNTGTEDIRRHQSMT